MPVIYFVNSNGERQAIDAPEGLSLMQVARNADTGIEASCGGHLVCGTCHVKVLEDTMLLLDAPQPDELDMISFLEGADAASRLACQIRIRDSHVGLTFSLA